MPSIYDLKPKFQSLLRPVAASLHHAGLTPNHITMAALAGSLAVGALSLNAAGNGRWLLLLPVWFFLRMALNAIDGMIARDYNLKSSFGAILNEGGDVISDIVLFLPLAFIRPDAAQAVVFFVLGAVLSEFCGVLGQALGAKRHYEGPMGKSDRAFFIGALALVSVIAPAVMEWWASILWMGAILAGVTCGNRIVAILKELDHA